MPCGAVERSDNFEAVRPITSITTNEVITSKD